MKQIANSIGLKLIHQPPDGDCLFYSIAESMILNKIQPFDFDGENNGSEYTVCEMLPITPGVDATTGLIHRNAALHIRSLLADKFIANKDEINEGLNTI